MGAIELIKSDLFRYAGTHHLRHLLKHMLKKLVFASPWHFGW